MPIESSTQTQFDEAMSHSTQTSPHLNRIPSSKNNSLRVDNSKDIYLQSLPVDESIHNHPPEDEQTNPMFIPFNVERMPLDPNGLNILYKRVKKLTGQTKLIRTPDVPFSPETSDGSDVLFDLDQIKAASNKSLKQTADALKGIYGSAFIYEVDEEETDDFDLD
jgi:hypothetical protein